MPTTPGELTDDDLFDLWLLRHEIHDGELRPQLIDLCRAAIAADRSRRGAVPEGWQLVPKMPTDAMMSHFTGVPYPALSVGKRVIAQSNYVAMLAAALAALPQEAQAEPRRPVPYAIRQCQQCGWYHSPHPCEYAARP